MGETMELPNYIREALHGRGYTDIQIGEMSADYIFDQYCGWELGDCNWGSNLRAVMEAAETFAKAHPKATPND